MDHAIDLLTQIAQVLLLLAFCGACVVVIATLVYLSHRDLFRGDD